MALESGVSSEFRAVARAWWLFALIGILSVVAGVIVLAEPAISLVTLAVVTGIFLLVDGVIELVSSLFDSVEHRGLVALFGVVTAIAGVILIRHPTHSIVAIALLFGLWILVAGLLRLLRAFSLRERRLSSSLLGGLEMLAGVVIVAVPDIGVATLALFVGISLILRGIALGLVGWSARALAHLPEPDPAGVATSHG